MNATLRKRILALMQDDKPRTASTLANELHGGKATDGEWLEVLRICNRLVEQGKLKRAGRNKIGQTLYKKMPC